MTLSHRMVPAFLSICVFFSTSSARAQEKSARTTQGTIERLDPRLDKIIPKDAQVERLADGFDWSEGPVWDKRGGFLLFSDVPQNTVFQYRDGSGVSVYLKPSGYTGKTPRGGEPGSNGLTLDPQGRLVLCQHGDRRVARLDDRQDASRRSSTATRASDSTAPTTRSSSRTATCISPTRPTAC